MYSWYSTLKNSSSQCAASLGHPCNCRYALPYGHRKCASSKRGHRCRLFQRHYTTLVCADSSACSRASERHDLIYLSHRLRSLDGLDTRDMAYERSIAGGVATSLILPGSSNAIGGQAFVIKIRETKERSPLAKVLEPPYNLLNGTRLDPTVPPRWRHMK